MGKLETMGILVGNPLIMFVIVVCFLAITLAALLSALSSTFSSLRYLNRRKTRLKS